MAANDRFRPPATPLVTVDPYFSVWSMADRLTDEPTRHWTGAEQPMCGLAYIDSKPYRFAGSTPAEVPPMKQVALRVDPTRTIYRFQAGGIDLTVTFVTPLLLSDPAVLGTARQLCRFPGRIGRRRKAQRQRVFRRVGRLGRGQTGSRGQVESRRVCGRAAIDRAQDRQSGAAGAAEVRRRSSHGLGLPLSGVCGRPELPRERHLGCRSPGVIRTDRDDPRFR